MSTLWNGKAVCLRECDKKAFWSYQINGDERRGLTPTGGKASMTRGAYIHDVVATARILLIEGKESDSRLALGHAMSLNKVPPEYEHQDEDKDTLLMLNSAWNMLQNANTVAPEKSLYWQRPNILWRGKVDGIEKTPSGYWVQELKTTARFGDALRRLYYKQLQPWVYFTMIREAHQEYTPLLGVKMYIAHPGKEIPPETIPITKSMSFRVKEFVEYSEEVYESWRYKINTSPDRLIKKDRTKCTNLFGDCPYDPLCEEGVEEREDYFNMLVSSYFKVEDPEAHLGV